MEVSPFRGIRYNQEAVRDLAGVLCPPYDVINHEQQKLYYEKNVYNAIRLEYPADSYQRTAITFRQWLKQGVLQVDAHPAFYLHDHYFSYLGERKLRRGLIARVKLEPWGAGIYPHEETAPKAKYDRLKLMRACRANFSPLFSLYQDPEQKLARILSVVSQGEPIIETSMHSPLMGEGQGEGDEKHIVWAITDPGLTSEISDFLSAQSLYIADGHHRYETALTYQQERTQCHCKQNEAISGQEAFNYVMMTLVEFSDPGLIILPVHRLVRNIAPLALADLRNQLENFFTLEFVSLPEKQSCHPERSEEFRLFVNAQDVFLGILGLEAESLVLLRPRRDISVEAMMPSNRSRAYREFSVSHLNHIVLDNMLKFTVKEENVAYTVDVNEAYRQIKEQKYQLAFMLAPLKSETVKAFVNANDRMPSKSTYFYPKLPTGLIINSLD